MRAVTDHGPSRETSPFGEVLLLCGQLHLTYSRARGFWESWGSRSYASGAVLGTLSTLWDHFP